jgi:hypothetical protein
MIGDPHMGRTFNNVPLHRRGERERMQLDDLRRELNVPCRMNIMVGDLFDKPLVDLKVVHAVADLYEEAADAHPETDFMVMAGNHDLFRQLRDKDGNPVRGAFHTFARMVGHIGNIYVLFEPDIYQGVAFFPWQWDVSAKDQVDALEYDYTHAVGHWDLADFGGSVEHLVPTRALADHGCTDIYGGHYHVAGEYVVDGISVHCTGSMQPYTHAEDPTGNFYRTLTLVELESIDPTNMNLRVLLAPGETLPEIDCLSLVSVREGEPESVEFNEVDLGEFKLTVVLDQKFEELQVPHTVQLFIKEKIGAID